MDRSTSMIRVTQSTKRSACICPVPLPNERGFCHFAAYKENSFYPLKTFRKFSLRNLIWKADERSSRVQLILITRLAKARFQTFFWGGFIWWGRRGLASNKAEEEQRPHFGPTHERPRTVWLPFLFLPIPLVNYVLFNLEPRRKRIQIESCAVRAWLLSRLTIARGAVAVPPVRLPPPFFPITFDFSFFFSLCFLAKEVFCRAYAKFIACLPF